MKQKAENQAKKPDVLMELLDWLKYILAAVLIGLLLVVFVVQRNSVVGYSMLPTLHDNDQLLVEKVSKWFNGIDYNDIVTINTNGLENHDGGPNIIKRVIGMPGDVIEIKEDAVYRNGQLIEEPYLEDGIRTSSRNPAYSQITLGSDEYYVMGDNRERSLDSRSFGPVPLKNMIGKVLIRFYPLDDLGIPR